MIRCLLVDDSPTFRAVLRLSLEERPGIAVVGEAGDGEEAIRLALELRPDVITMDVRMPRRDGIEATREIMRRAPARVLVLTAHQDLAMGLSALEAGALDVLAKPRGVRDNSFVAQAAVIRAAVVSVGERAVSEPDVPRIAAPAPVPARGGGAAPLVVGLGASTGGPAALARILAGLPAPFALPILVTQHLADGFHVGLAEWLAERTRHAVRVAGGGDRIRPGVVYLAPQDRHLCADGERILLSGAPAVDGFRPSATVLFRSLASAYGARAAGIVLTGMGRDGAAGLMALRDAGGFTAAQGPASSTVFGMPEVALRTGAAAASLELDDVPAALLRLASGAA